MKFGKLVFSWIVAFIKAASARAGSKRPVASKAARGKPSDTSDRSNIQPEDYFEADQEDVLLRTIRSHYNTDAPAFSYICGGLRKIAVDAADHRARIQLLRFGVRYFSKVQALIYALSEHLQPDLFVDVGVNYGECLLSLPLNSKTRVIGFEANPNLIPFIERSIRYNDDLQVSLRPVAVSDTTQETLAFYINKAWSGKSTAAAQTTANARNMDKILVASTTLDAELLPMAQGLNTVLVKVDVEGLEPRVLAGATAFNKAVPNVVYLIEFDTKFIKADGRTPEDFFAQLSDDFRIYLAQRREISLVSEYSDLDNIKGKTGRVHCDFLLVRSESPAFIESFESKFLDNPISSHVRGPWGLQPSAKMKSPVPA